MEIRIPSKKVCEEFHIIYELKGAQRGADVLSISLSPSKEVTPLEESSISEILKASWGILLMWQGSYFLDLRRIYT